MDPIPPGPENMWRGSHFSQVFIYSFMMATPIFSYLIDRFNRKVILSCGIFFWSAVTFSSSFIPQQGFQLLCLNSSIFPVQRDKMVFRHFHKPALQLGPSPCWPNWRDLQP
ncbi:hypothetical protein P7K49_014630 [Saguinus oedipus]|uniref:Uncharacterized protein n=1 Tax=Saguinus oedipus TaxID=9490 RepID=A0ABQ9V6V8_SAGOE|nr:hypothetical protein P7K49_014630 [Saguinus oedipus]